MSLKVAERGRESEGMTAGYPSTGFEGGRDHESKNVGGLWKLGEARKCVLSKASRMEYSPASTLILVKSDPCWVSDL